MKRRMPAIVRIAQAMFVLVALALFFVIDRSSHSVSDTLIAFVPFACILLLGIVLLEFRRRDTA